MFVQKLRIYELGKFWLSNRDKSTVIFTGFVYSITAKQVASSQTVLPSTSLDSSSYLKKAQQFTISEDELLGKVLIGNTNQPICVPVTSALTIPGRLGKKTRIPRWHTLPYLTQLLWTICCREFVNHCFTHPKGSAMPVIVINQNNHNVWIWQPLLAAEIFWVEYLPWDWIVQRGE